VCGFGCRQSHAHGGSIASAVDAELTAELRNPRAHSHYADPRRDHHAIRCLKAVPVVRYPKGHILPPIGEFHRYDAGVSMGGSLEHLGYGTKSVHATCHRQAVRTSAPPLEPGVAQTHYEMPCISDHLLLGRGGRNNRIEFEQVCASPARPTCPR
jgi:hypothetical protein